MVKNIMIVISILIVGIFRPAILVTFVFGLFPTFLCLLMLKRDMIALCVGIFNLCGVLPFIIQVSHEQMPLEHIFFYMLTAKNIFTMYCPALIGFGFSRFVSQLIVKVIKRHYEKKRENLKKELEELVEIWGEDITK